MNIQEYSIALATTFERNKNSSAIATSQSSTSRFLKTFDLNDHDFMPLVRCAFGNKKVNLVMDDGTICKRYAKEIDGISPQKN